MVLWYQVEKRTVRGTNLWCWIGEGDEKVSYFARSFVWILFSESNVTSTTVPSCQHKMMHPFKSHSINKLASSLSVFPKREFSPVPSKREQQSCHKGRKSALFLQELFFGFDVKPWIHNLRAGARTLRNDVYGLILILISLTIIQNDFSILPSSIREDQRHQRATTLRISFEVQVT